MSESVKQAVLAQLRQHKQVTPDDAVFIMGGIPYSADELIHEVEEETALGTMIIEEIIKTATDMFVRGSQ